MVGDETRRSGMGESGSGPGPEGSLNDDTLVESVAGIMFDGTIHGPSTERTGGESPGPDVAPDHPSIDHGSPSAEDERRSETPYVRDVTYDVPTKPEGPADLESAFGDRGDRGWTGRHRRRHRRRWSVSLAAVKRAYGEGDTAEDDGTVWATLVGP